LVISKKSVTFAVGMTAGYILRQLTTACGYKKNGDLSQATIFQQPKTIYYENKK
jgi:hypothetical protein